MKKGIFVAALVALLLILCSCNKQIIDFTYGYDKAIISLPDGEIISGTVDSWKDYEGDQLQVVIEGTTYLAHSSNIVLIKE